MVAIKKHRGDFKSSSKYVLVKMIRFMNNNNNKQSLFYNRETNSAAFCVICVFQTPLPFYATQIINRLSIIQWAQPIMKNFSQWGNPYTPYCFSIVESLLLKPYLFSILCKEYGRSIYYIFGYFSIYISFYLSFYLCIYISSFDIYLSLF